MLKKLLFAAVVFSLILSLAHQSQSNTNSVVAQESNQPLSGTVSGDLLTNGNLDNGPFYFRPTNHFVANMWYEWWYGSNLPEFLNGASPYHNQCYPVPTNSTGLCQGDKNKSQGYIRWGGPYTAGIYQPVQVTACKFYNFQAYVRNDANNYHPKVGIDPTGWQLPMPTNPVDPADCPPNGYSVCPDPRLDHVGNFPSSMVWGDDSDYSAYTWGVKSVTAEALSTTITVWTYVSPDPTGSQSRSTYWDYMSMVQVPPPNGMLIADGTLPAADGSITNVTTKTTALRAYLSWTTSQPALTQVLYHYVGDANMASPPPPATLTSAYEFSTTIDYNPATSHSTSLPNLRPMSLYDYAVLSRKLVGNTCQTSVYVGRLSTTDMLVTSGSLPTPSRDIIGTTVLPFESSAYVIWQSSQSSYAQVLYNYNGPITPTVYPTLTQPVFLPMVSMRLTVDSTANYGLHTAPVLTPTTLHIVKLDLQPDSWYSAVAVSSWSGGTQDPVAVSARATFHTGATSGLTAADLPMAQLAERLQACLSGGKQLEACVSELAK
jgi:hypothetical protein